jgi:gamma-glutamylcyclotransferase
MLSKRVQERCPSAKFISIVSLNGWQLKWHKKSIDGSGKCDIVKTDISTDIVYGVIYKVLETEKNMLDKAEGLGNGYNTAEIVFDNHLEVFSTITYLASDIDSELKPYTWYRDLVIAGAKEHSLPEAYINVILDVPSKKDLNSERCTKNCKLL